MRLSAFTCPLGQVCRSLTTRTVQYLLSFELLPQLQGVLSGDICLADGRIHPLHGSLCHLWVRYWAQDVHQEQLGCSGVLCDLFACLHISFTSLTRHVLSCLAVWCHTGQVMLAGQLIERCLSLASPLCKAVLHFLNNTSLAISPQFVLAQTDLLLL